MQFQNKKNNKRSLFVLWSAIAALFLGVFIFDGFPPGFIKSGAFYVSQPIFSLKNVVTEKIDSFAIYLKEKSVLRSQNIHLKQQLMELEIKEDFSAAIIWENKKLREALSLKDENNSSFIASILAYPGYSRYNSLVIDIGSKDGSEEGLPVSAFGRVLLGHIFDVSSDTSRVKLISHPGEELNVFVDNRISAIAIGIGGENLKMILPQEIEIEIGDIIATLGDNPFFVGLVEKIIKEPSDPLQEIFFRIPLNIQELNCVFLTR